MKNLRIVWVGAAIAMFAAGGCAPKDAAKEDAAATAISADSTPKAASDSSAGYATAAPVAVADSFVTSSGGKSFDAHRAEDLTGDGRTEMIAIHSAGSSAERSDVLLTIVGNSGDTLYAAKWNTRDYFKYSKPSSSDSSAFVLAKLRRVLGDSAFTAHFAKPDRDAILYDLKEQAVREKHSLSLAAPLTAPMLAEVEKMPVPSASVDKLIRELTGKPAFTYRPGGELTYIVSWSESLHRFVRVFRCC